MVHLVLLIMHFGLEHCLVISQNEKQTIGKDIQKTANSKTALIPWMPAEGYWPNKLSTVLDTRGSPRAYCESETENAVIKQLYCIIKELRGLYTRLKKMATGERGPEWYLLIKTTFALYCKNFM